MFTKTFNTLKLSLGIAALATVCSAAGSVASVTSAQPFSVDGVNLANPGVSSWPLVSNDEVSTSAGAALMTFRDGSAIKLAPQSRIRLAGSQASPEVILIAGNLDTKLVPGSKVMVMRATDADKDNGATPDYNGIANTAARRNNNTPFRAAALLYTASGVALGGFGVAMDAILQPTASVR